MTRATFIVLTVLALILLTLQVNQQCVPYGGAGGDPYREATGTQCRWFLSLNLTYFTGTTKLP